MVEFALIIPIFLLVVFGILDLGRAVYTYHTLNNAAREGARVAITDQTPTSIQSRAVERAVGVGATAADVTVDYRTAEAPDVPDSCAVRVGDPAETPVTCTVIVRVSNQFTAVTPIVGAILGVINLQGESSMVVQFGCWEPTIPCPATD